MSSGMKQLRTGIACTKRALVLAAFSALLIASPPVVAQNSTAMDHPGQGPVKRQTLPAALRVSPGAQPYVLNPANCGSGAPVLVFSVQVSNMGGSPSPAQPAPIIYTVDSSLNPPWMGSASLPGINPGQSVTVNVPVMQYSPPFAMGGNGGVTHNFRFLIKGAPSYQGENPHVTAPQIVVTLPAAFCMRRPPQPGQLNPKAAGISSTNPAAGGQPVPLPGAGGTQMSVAGGAGADKLEQSAATTGQPYQTGGSGNAIRHSADAAVRDAATPKVPADQLSAEVAARIKSNPSDRKAGAQIKFAPDTPDKLNHIAIMSALQKQFQAAEMERDTVLAAANPSTATHSSAAVERGVPAVQSSATGNSVGSAQTPACPSPSIFTMNGLPVPKPTSGTPGPPKGGGIRPLGQNGGTAIVANPGISAWFTTVPDYNLYTIRGCGFGQTRGAVLVSGFGGSIPPLSITTWNDTQIVASLDPTIWGAPDCSGCLTLAIYPQGAPPISVADFSFYAARKETPIYFFPPNQITAQQVTDLAGNPVVPAVSPPSSLYFGYSLTPGDFISMEVDRLGTLAFSVAEDTFDFSKMSRSFYLDRYQLEYIDFTTCGAGVSLDTVGNWATSWDPQARALHVSTRELHCHADPSYDRSVSVYAVKVWVVGPQGALPWYDTQQ